MEKYKKLIIALINDLEDKDVLIAIYTFIKTLIQE